MSSQVIPDKPFSLKHLWIWAIFHLVAWTLVPALCNTSLPLDSVEAVLWGSEWQWGYDKHPPLSAWAAELFALMFGDIGVYLLSQLCVVSAGIGIYKLARLLKLSEAQAVCSVVMLECLHFYTFSSVEFNVNIIQLPFWAWGWYWAMHAVENRRVLPWVGLGLCVGLGALAKYIAVFMLIPLFSAWYLRGQLWKVLRNPGLWLAGVISVVIFLPHLFWMYEHDWVTLTYGLDRTGSEESAWWQHLWFPLDYVLSNVAVLIPMLVIAVWSRIRIGLRSNAPRGALGLAFGGYAFMVLLSLVMGMEPVSMWAVPIPLAMGIWLTGRFGLERCPKQVLTVSAFMGLLAIVAYVIVYGMGPFIREKPHRVNYPGEVIAREVESIWQEAHEVKLSFVIADEWLGGLVNHYGEGRASVMIDGAQERSAYLTEDDIHHAGAMVLWLKSRDAASGAEKALDRVFPDVRERFPQLVEQEDLLIAWPRRADGKVGRYGLAIIPPSL